VTQRIAAPMIGGMITAPLLSMLVVPAVYLLVKQRDMSRGVTARTASSRVEIKR
jgi:copper/silver efflux system protein